MLDNVRADEARSSGNEYMHVRKTLPVGRAHGAQSPSEDNGIERATRGCRQCRPVRLAIEGRESVAGGAAGTNLRGWVVVLACIQGRATCAWSGSSPRTLTDRRAVVRNFGDA